MSGAETIERWPRVKWSRAGQVESLLDGMVDLDAVRDLPPPVAFQALRRNDAMQATRFIAQCLPRMEAVLWIAACLDRSGEPKSPVQSEARAAVRRWINNPSDKFRRMAFEVGQKAGWATADGAACLAVFLSGGSMAPAEQEQPVNPGPEVFGQAAAGAVLMAAHAHGPQQFDGQLATLLDLAEGIAAGRGAGTA